MNDKMLWGVWITWAVALLAYSLGWESQQALINSLLKIAPGIIFSILILTFIYYLISHKGLNMFKRKENPSENNFSSLPQQDDAITPVPLQQIVETVSSALKVENEATVIPSSCHINGEIKASGDMRINGSINGTITAEKTVYVLRQGNVEGDIYAEKVVVDGKVIGTCASETVEINAHGYIDGTVESDELSINKSGRFYGISKPRTPVKQEYSYKKFDNIVDDKTAKDNVADKESNADKLTIIQQVLNNVPDSIKS